MGWDSNPRAPARGLPVFETGALDRSATHPQAGMKFNGDRGRIRTGVESLAKEAPNLSSHPALH